MEYRGPSEKDLLLARKSRKSVLISKNLSTKWILVVILLQVGAVMLLALSVYRKDSSSNVTHHPILPHTTIPKPSITPKNFSTRNTDITTNGRKSHPKTLKSLPVNPTDKPPISLLHEMGMNPRYTQIICILTIPPTFRFKVDVQGHEYFGEASTKLHAKTAAAMTANEALFDIHYLSPVTLPKWPCVTSTGREFSFYEVEP